MTTNIVVKANHGWPVKCTAIDPKTGEPLGYIHPETKERIEYPPTIVDAGSERTISVHSGADLYIHEIQPGEEGFKRAEPAE